MPANNGRTSRNKQRSTRSRNRRISSTSSTTPSTTVAVYESRSDENNNYGCVDQVEKMVRIQTFLNLKIQI